MYPVDKREAQLNFMADAFRLQKAMKKKGLDKEAAEKRERRLRDPRVIRDRILMLAMKHNEAVYARHPEHAENQKKYPGLYPKIELEKFPELTPFEINEAAELLDIAFFEWTEASLDFGMLVEDGYAGNVNIYKFFRDINKLRPKRRTGVAFNPHASIVDAVFEAHTLGKGR